LLHIGQITPSGDGNLEVEFSLTPRGEPRWLKAKVPEHYSIIEADWLLRNMWANKEQYAHLKGDAPQVQLTAADEDFPDFPRPRGAR